MNARIFCVLLLDASVVMGLWTQKPETRGNNPTILLPELDPNPKIETRPIPETRHSKPENPRYFQGIQDIEILTKKVVIFV